MLTYKYGGLEIDGTPVAALAEEFGTPLYVYSGQRITGNYDNFEQAFSKIPHLICYAMKANANRAILQLLAKSGSGADVVSGGELYQAMHAGIPPARIVFSGVGKSDEEIQMAIMAKILMFNTESADELLQIQHLARALQRKVRVAVRINPDVDPETHPYIATGKNEHKFGIPLKRLDEVFRKAASLKNVEIVGLHVHLGSQITKLTPYRRAFQKVIELIDRFNRNGIRFSHLDLGGGFGIPYKHDQKRLVARDLADLVEPLLRKRGLQLILEPGRSITGDAGILVTKVLYVKKGLRRNFIVVDAGMNDLIRPSLYQAYHEIVPVKKRKGRKLIADIVGPVCETGDFLARNRGIQPCSPGDLLAVLNAGAYGFSMSSNYNGRPRAAEVMVDRESSRLVRKRESYEDLSRKEI